MQKCYSYVSRLLLSCSLLLFYTIGFPQFSPIPDTQRPSNGMGYLDNGTIKIGVNLNFGACITYLSRANSSTNLVNNADHGRQAQYSLYNGPDDFAQGSTDPNWRTLGWNPIEAGDHINNGPVVLNYANTGTTIYTKIRPLFWPLQNQEAECYFEKWITLDGNAAKVHFKVTMFRSDTRFFPAHPQELPCFYSIAEQYQHILYDGQSPFTNGGTTTLQMNAGDWQVGQYAPENWIGMKNPSTGDVAALWVKDVYEFIRWKIGSTNSGGEFGTDATYVTALPYMILDHNKTYETDAALLVGTESQVRSWVYAQPRPATLPNFQFNNSRERFTYYGNVTDAGEPNGELDVNISNESNFVISTPQVFYKASDLPTIYLKAKITGNINDLHIGWNKMGESSADVVTSNQYMSFAVNNDGASHVYAIPVSNHPNWNGSIKGFKFFHGPTSPTYTTGNIKIESITYNDPGGSTDPCDFNISATSSENNPQAGSSVTLTANCSGQCSGVNYSWSGNGISGANSTVTFNAPSTPGSYTYTLTASKTNCSNKTATVTLNVGGGTNCGYVDKQTVGTWSGLNVQTRLYSINGTPTWLIVTAINGSSTDKHYPRGKNFADRGDITWTNGVINKTCLGGEETAWGGLGMPSNVAVPSGYSQGSEQDGAIYFQQSCTPPSAPSLSASPSSITSGSSSTLTASGCSGGTITWSNGLGTGMSKTVSPTSTTVYMATCTVGGCTSSNASVTVTVSGTPPPTCNGLEGHFDNGSCDYISGWVYSSSAPNTVLNIDIYDGSTLIQSNIPADLFRQDLVDAGKGNGIHGFNIATPNVLKDGQSHSVTLKVAGCTYSLINSPRTISGCTGGCTPPSAPSLSASPSTITSGNTVSLSASGCSGGTITWSNSLGTGTSKTVSPTSTTTYTATCTINSCTSSAGSVTVTVNPVSNINCNTLEGHFDVATCNLIYGWAYDASHPNDPINVDLYDGSTLIMANILANTYRSDLQSAGKGNGVHGYQLSTPAALLDGQSHTLSIKVSGCNYTLTNSPKTISGCTGGSVVIGEEPVINAMRKLSVSPNPSTGSLYANFYLESGEHATLRITDLQGRTIYQKRIIGNGVHRELIDLMNKSTGALFMQLITKRSNGVQKIQIVR
jgi:hypothetical protein